jgi:hypothetical protein
MLAVVIVLILREFGIVDATFLGSLVTGASIVGIVSGGSFSKHLKRIFLNGFFYFILKNKFK